MAGNDSVEFDILVNGEPAKKSLKEVEEGVAKVEKQDKQTTSAMKVSWAAVGAAIVAAAATVGAMSKSARDLEKATFGLNKQTKDYIKNASNIHGMSQEIIAGFVQTGKAAGMGGDAIKTMIDQAVALGRAFPHESVEGFIDNLSMLSTAEEAQGYIVDVLEQKYGTVDLKLMSTADKMKFLMEKTKGVNEEFNKTKGAKFDQEMQKIANESITLGETFNNMIINSGIVTAIHGIMNTFDWMTGRFGVGIEAIGISFEMMKVVAIKSVRDILFGLEAIPGVGKLVEDSATRMSISYDIANDALKQSKKTLKENVIALKEVEEGADAASDAMAPDVGGFDSVIDDMSRFKSMIKDNINILRSELAAGDLTPEEVLFTEDAINAWAAKVQEGIGRGLSMDQAMQASSKSFKMMEVQVSDYDKMLQSVVTAGVSRLSSSLVDMAMSGKASFADMAKAMIADIAKIIVQQMMLNAIKNSAFGASLGFHTGTSEVKHTGGSIGGGTSIPSYHTGMRSDERIAKLQVGEAVVNRAGAANNGAAIDAMNSGHKIGGGTNVSVTVINNAGAEVTTQDDGQGNITLMLDAVANSITRGTGGVGSAMESRYGLSKR